MARKFIDLTGLAYYDSKIKAYVDAKAAEAGRGKLTFVAVDSLPATSAASANVVYLVPPTESSSVTDNIKEEYMLINGNFELIGTTAVNLSGKANKSEMSVTDGTGANADKTTIQLKTGTSVTALKTHQDISGKSAKASPLVSGSDMTGHLAGLDSQGNATDTGKASTSLVQEGDLIGITENEIDGLFVSPSQQGNSPSGPSTPTLISFIIKGNTYQAESGMTWADWVADENYDSSDVGINSNGKVISALNYTPIRNSNDVEQQSTDVIIGDEYYSFAAGGGG